MAIITAVGNTANKYRLNEENKREILWRKDSRGRWKRYGDPYASEEEATAALFALMRGDGDGQPGIGAGKQ